MQATNFETELRDVKAGLASVVEALRFLKGFIESEYGMRFQLQAFKATIQNHERISKDLEDLWEKYNNNKQHSSQPEEDSRKQDVTQSHSLVAAAAEPAVIAPPEGPQNLLNKGNDNATLSIGVETVVADNGDFENNYNDEEGNQESRYMSLEEGVKEEPFRLDPKTGKLIKKKSKKRKDSSNWSWTRELAKRNRMRGEAYTGHLKVEREDGKRHFVQVKPVSSRKLGPPCRSKFCGKSSNRHCTTFPENVRHMIFTEFWRQMDWDQKKVFVAEHSERVHTKWKDPCKKGRSETILYFLPMNGEKRQVCRNMMLSTLGVSRVMVLGWIRKMVPPPTIPMPEPKPITPTRKYVKKSEHMAKAKRPKPGLKCPYCHQLFYNRTEFHVHMADHMSQPGTENTDVGESSVKEENDISSDMDPLAME